MKTSKVFKKALSLFVVLVLMSQALIYTASAADEMKFIVAMPEGTVSNNGIVNIGVYVESNPGFCGFNLRLNYNSTYFQPVLPKNDAETADLLGPLLKTAGGFWQPGFSDNPNYIKAVWTRVTNVYGDGLLYTIRFRAKSNVTLTQEMFSVAVEPDNLPTTCPNPRKEKPKPIEVPIKTDIATPAPLKSFDPFPAKTLKGSISGDNLEFKTVKAIENGLPGSVNVRLESGPITSVFVPIFWDGSNSGLPSGTITKAGTYTFTAEWDKDNLPPGVKAPVGIVPPTIDVVILQNPSQTPLYTINVTSNEGGFTDGGGLYYEGETVTLNAIPLDKYWFLGWYENDKIVSLDYDYIFTATATRTIGARFTNIEPPVRYMITVIADEGGTVTGSGVYSVNESVTLTATPDRNKIFTGWYDKSDELVSTDNPYIFTPDDDYILKAQFEEAPEEILVTGVNVVDGTDGFTPVTVPHAGQKLTANILTSIGEIGSYPVNTNAVYKWYYKESTDTVLGTEPVYTVTLDNVGKTICVDVSVNGYVGTKTWEADDVVPTPTVTGVNVVDGTDGFTPVTVPHAGQKLTANILTSIGEIGSYPVNTNAVYKWYYKESTDTVLGTEPVYTVTFDNVGKTICVDVSVNGYVATKTWEADDVVPTPTVTGVNVVDGTDRFTPVTVPYVGQKLTANIQTDIGEIGSYPLNLNAVYKWYYKDSADTVLGTEPVYTVTSDNLDRIICVEVSVTGYEGIEIWEATGEVVVLTVTGVNVVDGTDGFTPVTVPVIGQLLTANIVTNVGEIGSYPLNPNAVYKWHYKDSDTILGTEPVYTVTLDNVGKVICVEVSLDGYEGSGNWDAEEAVPAPVVTGVNVVDGTDGFTPVTVPVVGQLLTANIITSIGEIGSYPLNPDAVYKWYYKDSDTILGTEPVYTVTSDNIGKIICVDVSVDGYTGTITWKAEGAVVPVQKFIITVSAGAGGTVTGGGEYEEGKDVTLRATPNSGYSFNGWYENNVKVFDNSTYTFKATANRTLQARFIIAKHTVTVNAGAGGTVTGGGEYEVGASVTLVAVPDSGYSFDGWYMDNVKVSDNSTYTLTVAGNSTLEARFTKNDDESSKFTPGGSGPNSSSSTPIKYKITVTAGIGGAVAGDGEYARGTLVTLVATPELGYKFDGWYVGDTKLDAGATYSFSATGSKTLEARFTETSVKPPTPIVPVLDKSGKTGYISGYPDNTVKAGNNITRYEVSVIFYKLCSNANKALYASQITKFSDVSAGQWYSEAVGFLSAAGVISGYENGTFRGGNTITRAEFASIASKFSKLNLVGDVPFSDVEGHWALNAITTAYNNGWISGYPDGTFSPNRLITRAETAVIINKILGWDSKSVTDGTTRFSDLAGSEWYFNDMVLATNGLS